MLREWLRSCVVLSLLSWSHSGNIKGPPVVRPQEKLKSYQLGHQVKLGCPIFAYPDPYYEWEKDGVAVDETWPRFQIKRRSLRIKSAQLSDAGDYTCLCVNGFGKESFTFTLHIYDYDLPPVGERTPPIFTELSPKTPFAVAVAEELSIICRATGVPSPKITWHKDGDLLHHTASHIHMGRISTSDAGVYTCRASNAVDVISHNFTITVEEHVWDRDMEIMEMTNVTVFEGRNATLQCNVKSTSPPEIQWFKRLSPDEFNALSVRERNSTLRRERKIYLPVSPPGAKSRRGGNSTYVARLTVSRATSSEDGSYVCVGATDKGFNFKEVFLSVIKSDSRSHVGMSLSEGDDVNWFLIIVPIALLVIIVAAIAIVYQIKKVPPEKSISTVASNPPLETEDTSANTPLNPFGSHPKGVVPLPPDLVYQDGNNYPPVHRPMVAQIKGSSIYPDHYLYQDSSYLDPNYSDPYPFPQPPHDPSRNGTDSRGFETRSSEHSYARLTQSTQSSTSPLPPPPYAYPYPHPHSPHQKHTACQYAQFQHSSVQSSPLSFTHSRSQAEPQYVVHYNL